MIQDPEKLRIAEMVEIHEKKAAGKIQCIIN